jgi:hypothetical protein
VILPFLYNILGARSFDLTILGEVQLNSTRKFIDFEKEVPADRLHAMLPGIVERCERERLNLIIRPRSGADRRLVQLDDLDQAAVGKMRELAFRVIETSLGNYQAWVCVLSADEEIERRLKRGVGADAGASGATRIAGSLNVKEQYREAGYPRVRLIVGMPERVASIEDLTELLEPEPQSPCVSPPSVSSHTQLAMPDYDDFLSRARSTAAGEIDRSSVDFAWAATALKRGHSVDAVMSELERVSLKAAGLSNHARRMYLRRTLMAAGRERL